MARAKAKTENIVEVKEDIIEVEETETTEKVVTNPEIGAVDATALIIELQRQLAEMQAQLNAKTLEPVTQQPFIIQQEKSYNSKKIKCINLMQNVLNVSTEPDGTGRVYGFNNYGDTRLIRYDDLVDIVSAYPYTMENGLLYIADKDVVEELGLSDLYEKIYTKEMLDEIIYLRKESDVDLFLGMEKNLQESNLRKVAELMNFGEHIDFNYIRRIRDEIGVDLEELARQLKLSSKEVDVKEKEKLLR